MTYDDMSIAWPHIVLKYFVVVVLLNCIFTFPILIISTLSLVRVVKCVAYFVSFILRPLLLFKRVYWLITFRFSIQVTSSMSFNDALYFSKNKNEENEKETIGKHRMIFVILRFERAKYTQNLSICPLHVASTQHTTFQFEQWQQ